MATSITVTLADLHELRARIDARRLQEDDWPLFGAFVSNLIRRTEARQRCLQAKAEQQVAAQQTQQDESGSGGDGLVDAESSCHSAPTHDSSDEAPGAPEADAGGPHADDGAATCGPAGGGPPRKGHGRNGADAFTSATICSHPLPAGVIGSLCEACACGPVSGYRDKVIVRVTGQPIFAARRCHFERGRCRLCGKVVTAPGTECVLKSGIGSSYIVYEWSACAMLIVMHYFAGAPFKRLEALHEGWGVPMPDANQWRVVDEADDLLSPLYKALEAHGIRKATALGIDDTNSAIIEVKRAIRQELEALEREGKSTKDVRTGINATAVHLHTPMGTVVLFFTGKHHAGEIIDRLLAHRKKGAKKLISVTDAASKNFDHGQGDKLEAAVCNAHCYLKFLGVKEQFPIEYAVAGEVYKIVFDNDDEANRRGLGPQDRMLYHRANSLPQMERLLQMCKEKVDDKLVEPNSPLWAPVSFVINQWPRLIKFCQVPGVPLDTNIVEQTLIIPVRYLAGSLAYKTQEGADVGDRHMSLIATANANGIEPVAYITDCLRNHEDLAERPEYYLPWNYRERLETAAHKAQAPQPRTSSTAGEVQHPLRPGTRRGNFEPPGSRPTKATPWPTCTDSGSIAGDNYATLRHSSGNSHREGSPPQMST